MYKTCSIYDLILRYFGIDLVLFILKKKKQIDLSHQVCYV